MLRWRRGQGCWRIRLRRKGWKRLLLLLGGSTALLGNAIWYRSRRWLIVTWGLRTFSRRYNRFVGVRRCNSRASTNGRRHTPRRMGDRKSPWKGLLLWSPIEGRLLRIRSLLGWRLSTRRLEA
jgi:hypothetical protein